MRYQQPQCLIGIDQKWKRRGHVLSLNGGTGPSDNFTFATNTLWKTLSPYGQGALVTGLTTNVATIAHDPRLAITGPFTAVVALNVRALGADQCFMIKGGTSNWSQSPWGLFIDATGKIKIGRCGVDVNNRSWYKSTTTIPANSLVVVAFRSDANSVATESTSSVTFFANGRRLTTALDYTIGTGAFIDNGGPLYIGNNLAGTGSVSLDIYQAHIFAAALTDAELIDLTRNPSQVYKKQRDLYLAVNNTGFITIGQSSETDTAQSITAAKYQAIGQTAESDATQTITAVKTLAVGQVTETESVQAITALKVAALAQASESDIAQPLVFGLSAAIGQAAETESAIAVVAAKTAVLGQVSETDAAQALVFGLSAVIGQVSEIDSTQSVAIAKSLSIGIDFETDTPLAVSAVKTVTLGQATEAESVASVTVSKYAALGQASEIETAHPIVASIVLGIVTETEFVQAIAYYKTLGVLQAVETESVHALTQSKSAALGLVTETNSALGFVMGVDAVPDIIFTVPSERRIFTVPSERRIFRQ